jgi:hypothetical protein
MNALSEISAVKCCVFPLRDISKTCEEVSVEQVVFAR